MLKTMTGSWLIRDWQVGSKMLPAKPEKQFTLLLHCNVRACVCVCECTRKHDPNSGTFEQHKERISPLSKGISW